MYDEDIWPCNNICECLQINIPRLVNETFDYLQVVFRLGSILLRLWQSKGELPSIGSLYVMKGLNRSSEGSNVSYSWCNTKTFVLLFSSQINLFAVCLDIYKTFYMNWAQTSAIFCTWTKRYLPLSNLVRIYCLFICYLYTFGLFLTSYWRRIPAFNSILCAFRKNSNIDSMAINWQQRIWNFCKTSWSSRCIYEV